MNVKPKLSKVVGPKYITDSPAQLKAIRSHPLGAGISPSYWKSWPCLVATMAFGRVVQMETLVPQWFLRWVNILIVEGIKDHRRSYLSTEPISHPSRLRKISGKIILFEGSFHQKG